MPLTEQLAQQLTTYIDKKANAIENPDLLDEDQRDALHVAAHEEYVEAVALAANVLEATSDEEEKRQVAREISEAIESVRESFKRIGDGLMGVSMIGTFIEDIQKFPDLDKYDPKKIRRMLDEIDIDSLMDDGPEEDDY